VPVEAASQSRVIDVADVGVTPKIWLGLPSELTPTTHVGAALNFPEAIVSTHAPAEIFPSEEAHEPDWLVIDDDPLQVPIKRSTRSAFDVSEVTEPGLTCGAKGMLVIVVGLFVHANEAAGVITTRPSSRTALVDRPVVE
jgi:hypothetical protein